MEYLPLRESEISYLSTVLKGQVLRGHGAFAEGHQEWIKDDNGRFPLPIDQSGLYHGYLEVAAEDGLPADNRRWLAFEARRADRLLLVDGEPSHSVFGNETYYLEIALRLALPDKHPTLTSFAL